MSKQISKGNHVDILRVSPKHTGHMIDPSVGVLSNFFHPLEVNHALRQYFQNKKCVALLDGGLHRLGLLLEKYMHNLDLEQLLEQTASEQISCWLKNSATGQIGTVRVSDAASALQLHAVGASLYFRSSQELADAFMGSIARELGFGPFGFFDERMQEVQGEVEVFVTRGGHRTGWHFDFQDGNFTIQLSGSKRWKLKRSNLRAPVRGATPHYSTTGDVMEHQLKTNRLCGPLTTATATGNPQMFEFNPGDAVLEQGCEEVILHAGDMLFFPAGMWHSVECLEDGVSLNFSCMAKTWAEVASEATRMALWRDDRWRQMASLLAVLHSGQPGVATCKARSTASTSSSASTLGLYTELFPSSLSASAAGEEADLPTVYASLEHMRQQALQRLQRALSPAAMAPPAAFLLNRLRPTGDDEEEAEGDEEEEEEEEEEDQRPVMHRKRQRAASAEQTPRKRKRDNSTDSSKEDEGSGEQGEEEDADADDGLSSLAGPGIAVQLRNGCILLDLTASTSTANSAGASVSDLSRWRFVWSPLASYSSHEELRANGAQPVQEDVEEEEEGSDLEVNGSCLARNKRQPPVAATETLVLHVNFGNGDLTNQLRVLLQASKQQAHVLKTLAAQADTSFAFDEVRALLLPSSAAVQKKSGGSRFPTPSATSAVSTGGVRGQTEDATARQATEVLLRAALFAGAVLPELPS